MISPLSVIQIIADRDAQIAQLVEQSIKMKKQAPKNLPFMVQ